MGKVFRLHRSSLRTKIAYFSALGFAVTALVLSFNLGTTLSADPIFSNPVTVAGGNRLYFDMNVRIRPTDGSAFVVGNKGDYVGLSVTNPANPGAALGFQNIVAGDGGYGYKYPSIAFSSNGTGYAVWRTVKDSNKRGYEAYLRVIPNNYLLNGNGNTNLGNGYYLTDRIPGGIKLDQPTVGVLNDGRVVVVGYYANSTTQLAMITFDANIVYQGIQILDNQPTGNVAEMDPQMCIDANNNIHILTLYPANNDRLAIYSRVGGGSFTVTDITPGGYDKRNGYGRAGKDIVCAPTNNGLAYAAVKSTGQYMFYKRPAGVGQVWGIGGQPNISNLFGYPNLTSVAITTSLDGRIYAAQGDGDNGSARSGTYVKYSDDGGNTFLPGPNNTNAIPVVPKSSYSNVSVAMDGNGPGGKVHLTSSFNGGQPESTFYSYANTVLAPPTNLTATAINSKQINLSWSASASAPENYKVYRSLPNQNSGFGLIATIPAVVSGVPNTTYQDNNLTYSATYYYKVTAVKVGFSDSADSNTASATTLGPSSVRFDTSPTTGASGAALSPLPNVTVLDQAGQTVTNYNGPVTFSITPGSGTSGALLSGSTNQNAINGVVTFSGSLSINKLGANYKLRATTSTGAYGDSADFNQKGTLVFGTNPTVHATEPFSIKVTIKQNLGADTATNYTGAVYLAFTPASGVNFYGLTTAFAGKAPSNAGEANFTNLMIDKVNPTGYTLTASLPDNLADPVTSTSIPVDAYTNSCSRILLSQDGITCSYTIENLQAAIAASIGKPIYLDHRSVSNTGYAASYQFTLNAQLNVPHGTWLDMGCGLPTSTVPQGLKLIVTSGFPSGSVPLSLNGPATGNNTFLRGIYLAVAPNTLPNSALQIVGSQTGNTFSCNKIAIETPAG